ncbi:hypothetical protein [Oleiphilus sp. HI0079]|uniref:hypothetical protein n=1 Tax=Oleiphilus sp. HI0079 TaxID=1822254 RepID=UPI000AB2DB7E|nr:hypothetical protein [Oleiphilus sp. HI0079]
MLFNIGEVLNNRWSWVNGSVEISLEEAKSEILNGHAGLLYAYNALRGIVPWTEGIEAYVDQDASSDVLAALEKAYNYAINGINRFVHSEEALDLGMLISVTRTIAENMGDVDIPLNCENIAALCTLRAELDSELGRDAPEDLWISGYAESDTFTLYQVSLLARMTEKAVRNATQPNNKDRLMTYKKGAKTLVTAKELDRWLKTRGNEKYSNLFYLLHESGDKLYPVRMKNRDNGQVAFRVSKGGTGGNTKEAGKEIMDEQEMKNLVLNEGYAVRAETKTGTKRRGLFKIDQRSIMKVVDTADPS